MRRAVSSLAAITLVTIAVLGSLASLGAAPVQDDPQPPKPGALEIDPAHSTLNFKVRHFGVSNFYGRVNQPKGWFLIDPDDLDHSFIQASVAVKNMDAGNDSRNRLLIGPDFFNAREYPETTFVSSRIVKTDDGYAATGTFTMHGVEREITAELREYTARDTTKFGYRAGFDAVFTVNRSDFGMDKFVAEGTLGDEVTIIAALEGVRR